MTEATGKARDAQIPHSCVCEVCGNEFSPRDYVSGIHEALLHLRREYLAKKLNVPMGYPKSASQVQNLGLMIDGIDLAIDAFRKATS